MSSTDTVRGTVTLRRTDSVHAASRVRHVDQLDEQARERFYELVDSGSPSAGVDGTSFVDGEIIVFTDYYRVEVA